MKGGYSHNSNHFTGKKKGIKTVMKKKKPKQKTAHKDKYQNQHDKIVYVEK